MSLRLCKECKAQISAKAKACPACGASTQSRWRYIIAPIMIVSIAAGFYLDNGETVTSSKAHDSPEIGAWAKLARPGYGCEKREDFEKARSLAWSHDRDALSLHMTSSCDLLSDGTEVWIEDSAPSIAAYQVRPRGSVQQFWVPKAIFTPKEAKSG